MQSHAKGENKRGIKLHKHHPTARSLPLASKQDIRSRNKTGLWVTSTLAGPVVSDKQTFLALSSELNLTLSHVLGILRLSARKMHLTKN
jgi:hypothetical protein